MLKSKINHLSAVRFALVPPPIPFRPMADSRKIIKVFLASPGDLQEERRAAKAVVDEFNRLSADDLLPVDAPDFG